MSGLFWWACVGDNVFCNAGQCMQYLLASYYKPFSNCNRNCACFPVGNMICVLSMRILLLYRSKDCYSGAWPE